MPGSALESHKRTRRPGRHRVLFCTWAYFPVPAGGAERQAQLQAEELARRGHSVTVVCPKDSTNAPAQVNGIAVVRLPRLQRYHLRTLSYLAILAIYLLIAGRRFDIIHIHLANVQADVAVVVARLIRRPTYVKVACGGELGEVMRMRRVSWLTRYTGLRGALRIQAISDEIARELRSIGVSPRRIVQIPNGVDLGRFSPAKGIEKEQLRSELGLPLTETLVLCTGRLAAYKGVLELLEVWRSTDVGATLVLVGSRDYTDTPMMKFEPPPRTIVRDFTHRVADYYKACDVFARPSYYEGMPNSVLEAMACGLPVVATPVGATTSLVTNGEEGLLVKPASATEVGTALSRLIDNEDLRLRMGRKARRKAERFAIETVVSQIERVYDGILDT